MAYTYWVILDLLKIWSCRGTLDTLEIGQPLIGNRGPGLLNDLSPSPEVSAAKSRAASTNAAAWEYPAIDPAIGYGWRGTRSDFILWAHLETGGPIFIYTISAEKTSPFRRGVCQSKLTGCGSQTRLEGRGNGKICSRSSADQAPTCYW
jgi:hypothetical protein